MEVLVSSFPPHIIKSLVGYAHILGVTQCTTWRQGINERKKYQGRFACSHCGDTRSRRLSGLIDPLDEFPLFLASMLDRDPVSDGLQVRWNLRIVPGFDQVIEPRLQFLDHTSTRISETFTNLPE